MKITQDDLESFRGGEMHLISGNVNEFPETLRGKIRKIRLKSPRPKKDSGEATVQTMDVIFSWIIEERTVIKGEDKKELRRAFKCFRYTLNDLSLKTDSIVRGDKRLEFTTTAGEKVVFLAKKHSESMRPRTLRKLFLEFKAKTQT